MLVKRSCWTVACALAALTSSPQWIWEQLADFPGTARDDAASFTIDGIIYVGTGMEVGWGLTTDWYAFDASTESWSPIAPLPATPRQYCAAFAANGKGFLFGGIDANGASNELWCYDPVLDEWTEKAPLPSEGRYACVAIGYWNTGQVATGMLASGQPTNEHWLYNADLDLWTSSQPVPGPARHRAAAFATSAFVIAGGADADGDALSDVWQYEIIFPTGEWMAGPDLPEPRLGAKCVSPNGLLIGGASDASTFHDDAWWFVNGTWTALTPFAGGIRRGGASGASAGEGGTAYFGTGLGSGLQRHRDWWALRGPIRIEEHDSTIIQVAPNPAQDELRVAFQMAGTRAYHVLDGSGRIVHAGSCASADFIDISALVAGHCMLQLVNDQSFRVPFVKLP